MASSNSDKNLPDWEHYSAEELEQALASLDRGQYPERVAIIQGLLGQRRSDPLRHKEVEQAAWNALPDWKHYSLDELRQALEGLDCRRYPDREEIIRELINSRSKDQL